MQTEKNLDLKTLFSYFQLHKGLFILIVTSMMLASIVYVTTLTPIYTATALVLIEKPIKTSITEDTPRSISLQLYDEDYYNTQYAILKSRSLASRVTSLLQVQNVEYFKKSSKDPVESFISLISVDPVRNSRLVKVSFDFPDPVMAAKFVNLLTSQYVEQNIESMLFMSKEMLKFLPDQKSEKNSSKIPISEKLKKLTESNDPEIYESLPAILNNPVLQSLRTRKIAIEAELSQLSKRYKHKHPKIVELVSEQDFINQKIKSETSKIIASIRAELAGKLQVNNIRIIDYAQIPQKPSKPKKLLILMISFLFSITAAFVVIIFIEMLNQTIKDSHMIEQNLNINEFGVIPNITSSMKLPVRDKSNIVGLFDASFDISESLRMIRTNLLFAIEKTKNNSLLITSSLPNEGKSFASLALATTFAKDGKKTLLIDGDLRIGGLSRFLTGTQSYGLTDYLLENKLDKQKLFMKIYKNITFIPAGKITDNPTELFDTTKMKELIKEVKAEYDIVIIDSPPSFIITDAFILSNLVNQVLFVIKYNTASIDILKKTLARYKELNINVIGGILNSVTVSKRSRYYTYGKYHDQYKRSANQINHN